MVERPNSSNELPKLSEDLTFKKFIIFVTPEGLECLYGYSGENNEELIEFSKKHCNAFYFYFEYRYDGLVTIGNKEVNVSIKGKDKNRVYILGEKITGEDAIKRYPKDPKVFMGGINPDVEYMRVEDWRGDNRWHILNPEDRVLVPQEV